MKKKFTHYLELEVNQILDKAARAGRCSKGRIIELLAKRFLTDRIQILTDEAKHHGDEMAKRYEEIKRLKGLRKEEEDKKKKLKI